MVLMMKGVAVMFVRVKVRGALRVLMV